MYSTILVSHVRDAEVVVANGRVPSGGRVDGVHVAGVADGSVCSASDQVDGTSYKSAQIIFKCGNDGWSGLFK